MLRLLGQDGKVQARAIQLTSVDGATLRVYSVEKTLADSFKFRNKISQDVALEALRLYRARQPVRPAGILKYARLCRVEQVMRPYLEAVLRIWRSATTLTTPTLWRRAARG